MGHLEDLSNDGSSSDGSEITVEEVLDVLVHHLIQLDLLLHQMLSVLEGKNSPKRPGGDI